MLSTLASDGELDEIFSAVEGGSRNRAVFLAIASLQRGVEHPLVLLLVAERLEEEGRSQEALRLLEKATVVAPEEAEVWRRFGRMLAKRGMLAEAVAALAAALEIEPDSYPTLVAAGATSYRSGNLKAAEDYYERANDTAPNQADVLSALAVIASRRRDCVRTRMLAERALALREDSLSAHIAIGRADLLENSAHLTVTRMTRLLGRSDLSDENRIAVLDLRAEALDILDCPAEAFGDYEARNAIVKRIHASVVISSLSERRVDEARRLVSYFSAASAEHWRGTAGEDTEGAHFVRRHIFLLGFPRSGTTLLEKALAGHPSVVTLEEIDCLGKAGKHFLGSASALEELASLTKAAADNCRHTYWDGVKKAVGKDVSGKLVIDKMPLHTLALPVIAKLFPTAKILFALRDPRDVVLSCFRRRFQINSAMYEFLTLDGAAQYYNQVMTLAKIYRSLLPLDVHEVRHESVVANFEVEVRKVLAFIGEEWDPAVKNFAGRAGVMPKTPSDVQLTRGLNSDGVGQWRRYQAQLAAGLQTLETWVGHFGYS